MTGPTDPNRPDDDDLIGFVSPASLEGRRREALAEAAAAGPVAQVRTAAAQRAASTDGVVNARELYAVYALILFTVPTLGLAGLIGLLARWRRPEPHDAIERSHFVFQRRTLVYGALAAVAGVVLMAAPFALGVPILFALFCWLILRGVWGVKTLREGRAIPNPLGWWI